MRAKITCGDKIDNVVARNMDLGERIELHGIPADVSVVPPGLIRASGTYTGDPPAWAPGTGFFARWR